MSTPCCPFLHVINLTQAAEPHVDDEQLQVELKQKLEACEEEKREFVLEISALKAQVLMQS